MAEQSSMHWYLNWAKQRIDEMDATLASFEAQAAKAKADSKVQADQLIAELKKQRDQFQVNANTQAQAGEAALKAGKAHLETQWRGFEVGMSRPISIPWASRLSSRNLPSWTSRPLR